MLWKSFNWLLNFWFWNSFIRYYNPGISFAVFSLHISRGEKYISLDSNCIVIVTKFCHIKVVISSYQFPLNTKVFFHKALAKPPVEMNMQPFWSKNFNATTVDLTAICTSWYICKLTEILDPSFWVRSPGLSWVFSFHVLRYGRNWFVMQQNLSLFSLIYGFRNRFLLFSCFS